jgi:hypothetical protein
MAPQFSSSSSNFSPVQPAEDPTTLASHTPQLKQGENTAETTSTSTYPRACNSILTVEQGNISIRSTLPRSTRPLSQVGTAELDFTKIC